METEEHIPDDMAKRIEATVARIHENFLKPDPVTHIRTRLAFYMKAASSGRLNFDDLYSQLNEQRSSTTDEVIFDLNRSQGFASFSEVVETLRLTQDSMIQSTCQEFAKYDLHVTVREKSIQVLASDQWKFTWELCWEHGRLLSRINGSIVDYFGSLDAVIVDKIKYDVFSFFVVAIQEIAKHLALKEPLPGSFIVRKACGAEGPG